MLEKGAGEEGRKEGRRERKGAKVRSGRNGEETKGKKYPQKNENDW